MPLEHCSVCGQYDFVDDHVCKPKWYCSLEDWDHESHHYTVHAIDAEEAAEKFAEIYDQDTAEYSIVGGEETLVLVTNEHLQKPVWFEVEGYSQPQYSAQEIDAPTAADDAH